MATHRKSSNQITTVTKSDPGVQEVQNEHLRYVRSLPNNINGQSWHYGDPDRKPSLSQSEEHLDNFPSSPENFEWMNMKPGRKGLSLISENDAQKLIEISEKHEEIFTDSQSEFDFEPKGSLLVNPPTPKVPPSSTMWNENSSLETYYFVSAPPTTAGDGDFAGASGLGTPVLLKSSSLQIGTEKLPEKMTICPAASVNSQSSGGKDGSPLSSLSVSSPPPRRRTLVERTADYKRPICRPAKVTCIPPCPCLRSRPNSEPWRICWGCGQVYRKRLQTPNCCQCQQPIPKTCYSSFGCSEQNSSDSARIEGSDIVFKLFPVVNVYQRDKEKTKISAKPKESGDTDSDKRAPEGYRSTVGIGKENADYDSSAKDSGWDTDTVTDYETEEVTSDSDF